MKVCKRCLYTSAHPLNLTFDDEGVCSGCRVHEEKDVLDWAERAEKLRELLDGYRDHSGNNYDCIIPVSGARDSYFIVHTVKKVYGMNPLLVTYNKQYNTALGVRNLAKLRGSLDCDLMTQTVNPGTVKKITRGTIRRFGSIYWHCLAGQTTFPVQVAVKFKIPLIIWGAHQGVDQVGMFSHLDEVEMTRKYRKEHDLMGYEAEDLVNEFDGIDERDVMPFLYPGNRELEQVGVRGIYLGNYIRWDSRAQHEQMIQQYGYETGIQPRTFDTYNDVDCWNYSDLHDFIKWIKHGYGKVVDHCCREIRLNRMSREDAVILVERYMYNPPKNLNLFLEWIGITENAFYYLIDQHRNKRFWARDDEWAWAGGAAWVNAIKQSALGDALSQRGPTFKEFQVTAHESCTDPEDKYILIGKGCS